MDKVGTKRQSPNQDTKVFKKSKHIENEIKQPPCGCTYPPNSELLTQKRMYLLNEALYKFFKVKIITVSTMNQYLKYIKAILHKSNNKDLVSVYLRYMDMTLDESTPEEIKTIRDNYLGPRLMPFDVSSLEKYDKFVIGANGPKENLEAFLKHAETRLALGLWMDTDYIKAFLYDNYYSQ